MKVLMITPAYFPNIAGGGEISCRLLVRELRRYVDIDVISFDGDEMQQVVDEVRVKRIKPVSISKILLNIQAYKILKQEVKNYDIFHTYNMTLLPAIGKLTKDYDINSVATLNGIIFSPSMSFYAFHKYVNPKFYRNKIMMRYIKQIKKFTTICPYYRDSWIKDGIEPNKIAVIPNMIDPAFPVFDKKDDDVIKILFVGNYAKWRNLNLLLNAYSRLEYNKNIELVIVGNGWDNIINRFKLKNKITYLGNVPYKEMPKIYALSDILVLPYSIPAPVSRTLLEAMQNKLCVIATGNDYYSPITRDMKDGILIYPMNSKKLAEKLQLLVEDEDLRNKLAENGKKRVYDVCSPDKIVKQYIELYEKVIK